jgi:hypothetical protein
MGHLPHCTAQACNNSSQEHAGHFVLTPSQVTEPRTAFPQLRFSALQLEPLTLLLQLTLVPSPQSTVAKHSSADFSIGRSAADAGAGAAREAMKA